MDRILAAVLLVALAPLSVLLLLALILLVRKPLYTSQRTGLYGKKFTILKFTTITTITPLSLRGWCFTILAATLRRTRLDELPQLLNIFHGEMAFIGPRPLLDADLDAMGCLAQHRRHVLPGLTGLAQVSGGRLLSPQEKLAMDLYYIEQHSPSLAFYILRQTFATVLCGDRRNEALVARAMLAYQHNVARQSQEPSLTLADETQALRPRLAMVCAYFWPELLGCAPYMTDLAQTFVHKAAVDVFAAIPHYPSKKHYDDGWKHSNALSPALRIHRCFVFDRSAGHLDIRVLNDLCFVAQVAFHLLRRWRAYDTVEVLVPSVLGVPVARACAGATRVVAYVTDIECGLAAATGLIGTGAATLFDALEAWCLNQADVVIVLTQQMQAYLENIGVQRPIHINPVWPILEPAEQPVIPSRAIVKYAGALAKRHGIPLLAPFWAQLQELQPHCELVIQAIGAEAEFLRSELRKIGGHVVFRSPVPAAELQDSLQEAQLSLVFQDARAATYSFPSKAIMSLAAGVPILSNAPAGSALADFIQASGGGRLVPEGTPEALAAVASHMLAHPEALHAMAQNGLEYVKRSYDREMILAAHWDIATSPHPAKET